MPSAQIRFAFRAIPLSCCRSPLFWPGFAIFGQFVPMAYAQPTLKTLSYNVGNDTYGGVMQASDGNFYSTSLITARVATPYSCQDNPNNTCTYITKIAPTAPLPSSTPCRNSTPRQNIDGMSPTPS